MDEQKTPNVSFFKAYQDLNDGFMDLVGAMSVLRSLSLIALNDLSEEQLLAKAMQVLVLNQDLERCSVFLLQGDKLVNGGGLDWPDLIGLSRGETPAGSCRSFRLGEGLVGIAAKTGELQHSRNCLQDSRFISDGSAPANGAVGSLIAVPVKANGSTIGVLNVSHPHTEFFSVGHERVLQVFANFLGQMILSRRLQVRMDSLVRERTEQLQRALQEAEALKTRYAEISLVDELTGLYNRRHFFPAARAALAHAMRYGTDFAVLLLDIDHFKLINDTFGHASGDRALCDFAALLRQECRESDILARFGGEEFVLALPETGAEGARLLAERIRVAAKSWRGSADGRSMSMTVSLGVSCRLAKDAVGENVELALDRLIGEADQALYFGKHSGRDQYRLFQEIACRL
jgi:diguanylate cyclase (GGDEF)-like protein